MRILFVTSALVDEKLGIGKVLLGLERELIPRSFKVDFFDYKRAFPKGQTKLDKVFGALFYERLRDFLVKNAQSYDVIDYSVGDLPFSKSDLGFKGIYIARSHGLPLMHSIIEKTYLEKIQLDPQFSIRKYIGSGLRALERKSPSNLVSRSLDISDRIVVPNQDEETFLKINYSAWGDKTIFIPHGSTCVENNPNLISTQERFDSNEIVYIGRWSKHKGSHDLEKIFSQLSSVNKKLRFKILGVGEGRALELARSMTDKLNRVVIPKFSPSDLPSLIGSAKLGVFPSYMEGFGFAVLEQLCLGIPVVTYDIPGIRPIISGQSGALTSTLGDWNKLFLKAQKILELPYKEYQNLSLSCMDTSSSFSWRSSVEKYIQIFKQ
jgi:glycosyltransferase involved in cell wall biosynthesis